MSIKYCIVGACTHPTSLEHGYCEYHEYKAPRNYADIAARVYARNNSIRAMEGRLDAQYQTSLAPDVHTCEDTTCENQTALRYNTGKVDLTLIPVDAAEAEARVWMKGAEKYGRANWTKLWGDSTVDVALASLLRHAAAIQKGEHRDPETGELHAGHIRCNAAMLIRYALETVEAEKDVA